MLPAKKPEFLQKVRIEQRFSAAEGNTSAGGEKVQVVDFHLVIELLRGHVRVLGIRRKGKGIDAPMAAQRTTVETHQGGDTLAVCLHPQTGAGYDGRYLFHRLIKDQSHRSGSAGTPIKVGGTSSPVGAGNGSPISSPSVGWA